jgi:carbamoyl-phosphate synthase small subunit
VNLDDEESDHPQIKGAIARNITYTPSNWRSRQSLHDYLKAHNVVAIGGIDTRALTRKLRSLGAMNGGISTEILDPEVLLTQVKAAPSMQGLNLAQTVTTPRIYEWQEPTLEAWEFMEPQQSDTNPPLTVVAIDFGVKRNILRRLVSYGCRVVVVPADTSIDKILEFNPDGIFLSNGPGDPSAVTGGIETAKALLNLNKPIFGICLGHQILGLSLGGDAFKLKFGHRGLNQPAQDQSGSSDRRVEITSQNHGFALNGDSLTDSEAEITHINLNDHTVAGLKHKTLPIFSVQYHPEASPGPHDADYLFADFVKSMAEAREVKKV